jgi:F-type H+-transporting ATPase subunit b
VAGGAAFSTALTVESERERRKATAARVLASLTPRAWDVIKIALPGPHGLHRGWTSAGGQSSDLGTGTNSQERTSEPYHMGLMAQLKGLFLQAVPTIVLVVIFYFFLRSQFFGPLTRVMAERDRRTEGARREAEESTAAAQKAREAYEAALRKARAEVYAGQEAERRKALDQRAAAVRAAHEQATTLVHAGKTQIEAEAVSARKQLGSESAALGSEIARVLLASRGGQPRPGSGGAA